MLFRSYEKLDAIEQAQKWTSKHASFYTPSEYYGISEYLADDGKLPEKYEKHNYHFMQNGGLIQARISTIDDVLNLKDLDPKMWTALACPVKGLEFSEETLSILDTDKNGRVRVPEILQTIEYIKKYFSKPEVIMEPADSIPLDAMSDEPFGCGHSPSASAKSILHILGIFSSRF
mgnify:CR=1 FL=1